MPILKIPARFRSGIARVAFLDDAQFAGLVSALAKAPECNDLVELAIWIKDETSTLSDKDRTSILSAAVSMAGVRRLNEVKAENFADDIWESLSDQSPDLLKGADKLGFTKRVAELVSIPNLEMPETKRGDLKGEVERSYCEGRIMTDLRAAFKKEVEDGPTMMVLLHNLKIAYHDDTGQHREFYVTMDDEDLDALQRIVVRAKKKSAVLKSSLQKAQIKVIG